MNQLRYGLIGAKDHGISAEHIRTIVQLPDVELVALCDTNGDHLARAAELVPGQVTCFRNSEAMLEQASLDVAVIATPNFTHETLALQAFKSGVHVLCEKPLALTLEGCDAIIAAARQANRLLQVGLHRRYNRLFERLQDLIDVGELGTPCMMWTQEFRGDWAASCLHSDRELGLVNWRHSQELSGGSLVEKNCHDFDTFNCFANSEPTRVMASGGVAGYAGRDTIDHAIVIVEYANGFKATLNFCLFVPHGFHGRYVGLIGDQGSVKIHEGTQELFQYFRDRPSEVRYATLDTTAGHGHGIYQQHVSFATCIREGKQPLADGIAARASIAVALAAEESIRIGEPVLVHPAPSVHGSAEQ